MKEYKYYGTNTFFVPNEEFTKKYGKNHHNQWRVVCKARSFAEANRIAESFGLYKNTFTPSYTSETGNLKEIELCDLYGFISATDGTCGRNYVNIKEIL